MNNVMIIIILMEMDVILNAKLKKIIFAIFGKQMVIAGVMSAEMELLMKTVSSVMMVIKSLRCVWMERPNA